MEPENTTNVDNILEVQKTEDNSIISEIKRPPATLKIVLSFHFN